MLFLESFIFVMTGIINLSLHHLCRRHRFRYKVLDRTIKTATTHNSRKAQILTERSFLIINFCHR